MKSYIFTPNDNMRAYLELSAAMVIVGSSVVVGKLLIEDFPVFLASGIRYGIAALLFIPLLIFSEGGFPRLNKKDALILTLQALTGLFGFSLCLLYGLKYTTAIESGIITSTTPAVIGIISFLFLKEKLRLNKALGITLAVIGIIAMNGINGSGGVFQRAHHWMGNILIFGAVVGESLFTIFGKVLSGRLSSLAISTFVTIFGFLMFLPMAVFEACQFHFRAVTISGWVSILYYAVVVTVAAFFLWYSGVSKVTGSTAAVFTGILPISAVLLSWIFLKETILPKHSIGIIFVIAGLAISSKEQNLSVKGKG